MILGASQFWIIATLMVVVTTAVVVVPLFWLRRGTPAAADGTTRALPPRWLAFALAAGLPLVALTAYYFVGKPELANAAASPTAVTDVATMHARQALPGGKDGGDLDAAIERLRARLAANPADANGWRLLAQSYEFQGRSAEAAQAIKQAEGAEQGAPPAAGSDVPAARSIAPAPAEVALAQSAEDHRRRREFAAAVQDFEKLAARGALSADQWADYADALGGAHGKLDDAAAKCIEAALRLDPRHPKALWLKASWQTERKDHAAAIATWQTLASVLPADSPDARIIAANLAEAREKAGAAAPAARPAAAAGAASVRGRVRVDPRWSSRISPGSVLFVFARAADERGPPLAVLRTTAGPWPISFNLDDSDAMMPDRKLSGFNRVILEARISRSGNALAQAGDLRAVSAVLDPRSAPELDLNIAEEVGPPAQTGGG